MTDKSLTSSNRRSNYKKGVYFHPAFQSSSALIENSLEESACRVLTLYYQADKHFFTETMPAQVQKQVQQKNYPLLGVQWNVNPGQSVHMIELVLSDQILKTPTLQTLQTHSKLEITDPYAVQWVLPFIPAHKDHLEYFTGFFDKAQQNSRWVYLASDEEIEDPQNSSKFLKRMKQTLVRVFSRYFEEATVQQWIQDQKVRIEFETFLIK